VEIPFEKIVVRKEGILDQMKRYLKRYLFWIILIVSLAVLVKVGWKFIKPF
jgi:predicted negative regulator of RcsB-dependent stress response